SLCAVVARQPSRFAVRMPPNISGAALRITASRVSTPHSTAARPVAGSCSHPPAAHVSIVHGSPSSHTAGLVVSHATAAGMVVGVAPTGSVVLVPVRGTVVTVIVIVLLDVASIVLSE